MGSEGQRPSARRRRPTPAVYRRRRIVAVAVLVLIVALVVWVVGALTPDGTASTSAVDPGADEVRTSVTTPAASPPAPSRTPARTPLDIPDSAGGRLIPVGLDLAASTTSGRVVRYAVEIEAGLPVPGEPFSRAVHAVLGDPRGWQAVEGVRLVQVRDRAEADLTVTLASPSRTDALCRPLDTGGRVSCWNSERAVLNARRWASGASTYGSDLAGYRRYLISHEVGHGLGRQHVGCPRPGAPAPVMVQQTKSLDGCAPNPYPGVGL